MSFVIELFDGRAVASLIVLFILNTPFGLAKFHADVYGNFTTDANDQCKEALQRNNLLRVPAAILKSIEYEIKVIQDCWNGERKNLSLITMMKSASSIGKFMKTLKHLSEDRNPEESHKYLIEQGVTVYLRLILLMISI